MKKNHNQINFIRLEVNVEEGFGNYMYYIGYCKKCNKYNIHTSIGGVSEMKDTCEKGHFSDGYMDTDMFKRETKKIMSAIKKLLKKYKI